MSEEEDKGGPRVVWTFPLLRRIQGGPKIIGSADKLSEIGSLFDGVMGSGGVVGGNVNIQEDIERLRSIDGGEKESDDGDFSNTSSIQEQITEIREKSQFTFSQDEEPDLTTIDIEDGVFIPGKLQVDEGETVVWVNNDDETYEIQSIEGDEINSGELEPEETYENTFEQEGIYLYADVDEGPEEMSGAVLVGDVSDAIELPSQEEQDFEVFEEPGEVDVDADGAEADIDVNTRSMSSAAEEKENRGRGFEN